MGIPQLCLIFFWSIKDPKPRGIQSMCCEVVPKIPSRLVGL